MCVKKNLYLKEFVIEQCHKSTTQDNSCDCQANSHKRQHQQNHGEHRSRKGEGKGRHHHHHHQKKKMDVDYETASLIKQKEKLKQEIIKLQNLKSMNVNNMYPMIGAEDQNMLSNMCAKLYAQEQKHKCLQLFYQNQQKDNERMLQGNLHATHFEIFLRGGVTLCFIWSFLYSNVESTLFRDCRFTVCHQSN